MGRQGKLLCTMVGEQAGSSLGNMGNWGPIGGGSHFVAKGNSLG